MSNAKQIEMARGLLKGGNTIAYAQMMSAAIRSAQTSKADRDIRAAITEDGTEAHFVALHTAVPVAL